MERCNCEGRLLRYWRKGGGRDKEVRMKKVDGKEV